MRRLLISFLLFCLTTPCFGANKNQKNLIGYAYKGNMDKVKKYLPLSENPNEYVETKASLPILNSKWLNPLAAAAYEGHSDVVALLLNPAKENITPQQSINIEAKSPEPDFTPLFYAVAGKQLETARELINAGANVNAKGFDDNTPLHIAAGLGLDDVAELLIQYGADLDLENKQGLTPLALAQDRGRDSTAKILREAATRQQPEEDKLKELITAAWDGDTDAVNKLVGELPEGITIDSYITQKELGVSNEDEEVNALSAAAMQGHLDTVKALIEQHNANINAQNNDGTTVLMFIVDVAREAEGDLHLKLLTVFRYLLDRNPDLSLQDVNGYTVVHWSVNLPRAKFLYLQYLLAKKPIKALETKDNQGETPLDLAKNLNATKYIQMIEAVMPEKPPVVDETAILIRNLQQLASTLDAVTTSLKPTPPPKPKTKPTKPKRPDIPPRPTKPGEAPEEKKYEDPLKTRSTGPAGRKPPTRRKRR